MRIVRLREVVREVRRPIDVAPGAAYREIGIRSFGRGVFHKDEILGADLGAKNVFEVVPCAITLGHNMSKLRYNPEIAEVTQG